MNFVDLADSMAESASSESALSAVYYFIFICFGSIYEKMSHALPLMVISMLGVGSGGCAFMHKNNQHNTKINCCSFMVFTASTY